MDDLVLPGEIAIAMGAAVVAGFGALWRRIDHVEKREREECAQKIERLDKRIAALESDGAKWRDRWVKEVERGAGLACQPRRPDEPPPSELPPSEWDDSTELKRVRRAIEKPVLDDELKRYVGESTPPKR